MQKTQLRNLAKQFRSTRNTLAQAKLMAKVPLKDQSEFIAIVEKIGELGGDAFEIYTNKQGEQVGYLIRCKGTGKRGHYISNDLMDNFDELVETVKQYKNI